MCVCCILCSLSCSEDSSSDPDIDWRVHQQESSWVRHGAVYIFFNLFVCLVWERLMR